MASGTISAEEFVKLAIAFHKISVDIGENWCLESIQVTGQENVQFLTKKVTRLLKLEDNIQVTQDDHEIEESSCMAPCDNENSLTPCSFDYHVVHSCSYSVPVLYFNAYKPDGELLSLEELWNCIPEEHRHLLTEEKWSFITQQEHPILHRPFFQLHPCHTNDLMKIFSPKSDAVEDNYLITWLSSVGPVVHLNLPLEYILRKSGRVKLKEDPS